MFRINRIPAKLASIGNTGRLEMTLNTVSMLPIQRDGRCTK